jgi:hypothetical protein
MMEYISVQIQLQRLSLHLPVEYINTRVFTSEWGITRENWLTYFLFYNDLRNEFIFLFGDGVSPEKKK